jgi:hypothetical protein
VRGISRSSVPCSSIRSFCSVVDILGEDTELPVECQGEQIPRWGTALHSKNVLTEDCGLARPDVNYRPSGKSKRKFRLVSEACRGARQSAAHEP